MFDCDQVFTYLEQHNAIAHHLFLEYLVLEFKTTVHFNFFSLTLKGS